MISRSRLATLVSCTTLLGLSAAIGPVAVAANGIPNSAVVSSAVSDMNAFVQANPSRFGGIYLDQQSGTVHVTVAPGMDSATLAKTQQISTKASGTKIVVDKVPLSYADLQKVLAEVSIKEPWATDTKDIRSSWGIDPITDKVAIGVTTLTPQVLQEARLAFGDSVRLYQEARNSALIRTTWVKSPRIVNVRAARSKSNVPATANPAIAGPPLIDSTPYIDGDRMTREIFFPDGSTEIEQCTVGLTWNNGGPELFMGSAGHCGPVNKPWLQGYFDPSQNTVFETGPMGTPFDNPFSDGNIDGMLMDQGGIIGYYATEMWQNISGQYAISPVKFIHDAMVGEHVCFNGSFTGTRCSGTVTSADSCVPIEYKNPDTLIVSVITSCHLATVTSPEQIVQPGDSGGPVFFGNPADGAVGATGIISAGNAAGTTAFYTNRSGFQGFFSGNFDVMP